MNSLKEMNPLLGKFIADVAQLVKEEKDEQIVTKKVAKRMEQFLDEKAVIPEAFKQPNPDKYTLYPLYIAPDNSFSIASAVWDVGQSTPVHDHGTWGVIGIVQGKEDEVHYEVSTKGEPLKKLMHRELHTGDVAVCCTSDQDVHQVSCASQVPCVGIHVYGGNIGEMKRHVYHPKTSEKRAVVTAWDPVPTSH